VGRPILAPPGLPEDRAEALRAAFDATMKDPKFIAEANKQRMEISPMSGEELQAVVDKIVSVSPKVAAAVKEAITIRDVNELRR
jgi:tripartite-type tricarboxylate transporter receptor subunit TctC